MQRASLKKVEWRRYKEVSIPWAHYDACRLSECKRILDLRNLFFELDRPVQRREFKLSNLVVLLLLKTMFGIPYRTLASATKDLKIYQVLGLKRAPCYKTIQKTMDYLDEKLLIKINKLLVPNCVTLAGVDSSGIKTNRKGAWVQIILKRPARRLDFKKIHIFVDLESKKILYSLLDGAYDSRGCFNEIAKHKAVPGIPVRKNASRLSLGSPTRRKAVIEQHEDYKKWKLKVNYSMRCVVECIFSGAKRRFGEYLFSVKERFRRVEMWLRTILWNVLIYPR
jgi:hypothetical protein